MGGGRLQLRQEAALEEANQEKIAVNYGAAAVKRARTFSRHHFSFKAAGSLLSTVPDFFFHFVVVVFLFPSTRFDGIQVSL